MKSVARRQVCAALRQGAPQEAPFRLVRPLRERPMDEETLRHAMRRYQIRSRSAPASEPEGFSAIKKRLLERYGAEVDRGPSRDGAIKVTARLAFPASDRALDRGLDSFVRGFGFQLCRESRLAGAKSMVSTYVVSTRKDGEEEGKAESVALRLERLAGMLADKKLVPRAELPEPVTAGKRPALVALCPEESLAASACMRLRP